MTRLVLHIGYGKTGTTYLQASLSRNRDALLSRHVLYPKMIRGLTKHAPLVPYLSGQENPGPYHYTWAETDPFQESRHHWQDTLEQIAATQPETVIISDESLINSTERATNLAKNLTPYFSDIQVVAYIDSPQKLFLKKAQQQLRTRGFMPIQLISPMRTQLAWFAAQPAFKLNLHAYDRATFPKGDVLAHFTGLYCPGWEEIEAVLPNSDLNTGLSAEAMAVAEFYGARWQEKSLAKRQKKWIDMSRALMAADRAIPGFRKPELRSDFSEYIQRAHPDIVWLRETHGIAFRDVDYHVASTGWPGETPKITVPNICLVDTERQAAIRAVIEGTVDSQALV